jgi:hypothetical protein
MAAPIKLSLGSTVEDAASIFGDGDFQLPEQARQLRLEGLCWGKVFCRGARMIPLSAFGFRFRCHQQIFQAVARCTKVVAYREGSARMPPGSRRDREAAAGGTCNEVLGFSTALFPPEHRPNRRNKQDHQTSTAEDNGAKRRSGGSKGKARGDGAGGGRGGRGAGRRNLGADTAAPSLGKRGSSAAGVADNRSTSIVRTGICNVFCAGQLKELAPKQKGCDPCMKDLFTMRRDAKAGGKESQKLLAEAEKPGNEEMLKDIHTKWIEVPW